MRLFLGMILGAVLTVALAYVHDTNAVARTPAGQTMVNWDVVNRNWQDLRTSVRAMGDRIHDEWVKRAG